jgi:hypothetical protein
MILPFERLLAGSLADLSRRHKLRAGYNLAYPVDTHTH